jgi:hypothetical protein
MTAVPNLVERRKNCRVDLNLKARIRVPNGSSVSCTVKNISSMGAYVEFDGPTLLPDNFKIMIPDYWFEANCQVRHAHSEGVGVMFTSNRREALARFSSPFAHDDCG